MSRILVVEDEKIIRQAVKRLLERQGHEIFEADSLHVAKELTFSDYDMIISDLRLPGGNGTELIELAGDTPVLIMTSYASLRSAVDAMKLGAVDYIAKPFDHEEMLLTVERILKQRNLSRTNEVLQHEVAKEYPVTGIIGSSLLMQKLFSKISKVAPTDATVLIQGESGTGKELVARALHTQSRRKDAPMISVNCAAIPESLIESELFGHEKGAFTGADSVRKGRFEQANGGTLFLDEIGDMPLDVQTRLLRVLADGEFYRVGGHQSIKVDVRIIAATHQNLEDLVKQGKFRDDLFHRLNVVRLRLPALRERTEDIERLAQHFLHKSAKDLQVDSKILSPKATDQLRLFSWPGNVRQLENTCRWLTVMAPGELVSEQDLPPEILDASPTQQEGDWLDAFQQWLNQELKQGKENIWPDIQAQLETRLIKTALANCSGHKQDAAIKIGWGRNTLTRKLKERNIN